MISVVKFQFVGAGDSASTSALVGGGEVALEFEVWSGVKEFIGGFRGPQFSNGLDALGGGEG